MNTDFETELQQLLNRYSKENVSNTPDFVLSHYLLSCLRAFNMAVNRREAYYGRHEPLTTPKRSIYEKI